MGKLVKNLKIYWPILTILVFAFLLRVYSIEELFYFTYDESIPAFVGRRMLLWQHVPLIGGVTPFGFHLTPYFYWFLSGILALGNLNPIAWGWAGAALAAATSIMLIILGKEFANKKVGITAAILWVFSYLANIFDRHLWALYPGPLLSLIILYSLYKIKNGSENAVFLLSAALIIGMSADPSNLVLVLLSILVWIIYKLPVNRKTILAIAIIVISFLPLIVFDLRHNFANTKPLIEFWQQGSNKAGLNPVRLTSNLLIFPQGFVRLIYTFGDNNIAKQYSYNPSHVSEKYKSIPQILVIVSSILIISFLIWTSREKDNIGWKLVSLLIMLYIIGIQIYGTVFKADIFEHYITGVFTSFILILAKFIGFLPKKIWLFILSIFIILNMYKLFNTKNSHGLVYKKQAIQFTQEKLGENAFSLDSLSTNWRLSGYRYLFSIFGREPVKSYVDPNFGYLYGATQIAEKHPDTVVVFVTHDFEKESNQFYRRYVLLKSYEKENALFGNIEVIIMDNSTQWFENTN